MLGNQVEKHELSIEQHQHSRFADIHPSPSMDWQEIMSWYSIDRLILWRILTAEGILQLGPFGADNDGGYHNPQVPGFRWHWDPGESIGEMIGQRIVWDPGKSIPGRIGQRIEGSIQDHSTWRSHRIVWDPGINVQRLLLWIEADRLRTNNLWEGGFVIFPFLIQSNWTKLIHGTYRGIFPWYQPMVFVVSF